MNQDSSTPPEAEFLGQLRLGHRLNGVGQVAAGGLALAAAHSLLLAGPALGLAGTGAVLGALLAGLVVGFSLLTVLELLGGSGEHGGTYMLVHETLGGLGAFLTGWCVLAAAVALLAALTQAAATQVMELVPSLQGSLLPLSVGLLAILVATQWLHILQHRTWLGWLAVLVLALYTLILLSALPRLDPRSYKVATELTLERLLRAAAGLSSLYLVLEAVLTTRRQTRDPRRLLPRAMWATLLICAVVLSLTVLIVTALGPSAPREPADLVRALSIASSTPPWVTRLSLLLALALGALSSMRTATAQLYALSRQGSLPGLLVRTWHSLPAPPILITALGAMSLSLVALMPAQQLIGLAAATCLVAMTLLNVASVHSHRTEPQRRHWFNLPFQPLVPVLASVMSLVLLRALPDNTLRHVGAWLLLGTLVYVVYARRHEAVTKQGELVFGAEREERTKGAYRILVPLAPHDPQRQAVLNLAVALAHRLSGEVVPLQVIPSPDPLAIERGRRVAQESNALFRLSTRIGEAAGVHVIPITRLSHSVTEGILDSAAEEDCDLILMSWPVSPRTRGSRMGRIVDPVVRNAPCDVAVLTYQPASRQRADAGPSREALDSALPVDVTRILVPVAGGPHAPLAMHLAALLAQEHQATVTAVYVIEPEASAEETAAGHDHLAQTLAAMQEADQALQGMIIETEVLRADNVVEGIVTAAQEHDLVLLGASEEPLIDQVIFGNVPERVARASPTATVMTKKYGGLPRLWLQRLWSAVYQALPQLSARRRVQIYRELRSGARADADFFVMISLSAIIATFGLLQGSTAVIIGAMLVAPLFTPILGLSLALVRGDARLSLMALESTLKGVAMAVGMALVLAWISPLRTITPQFIARTRPNLFDLAIALASGAAGAYAISRRDVASALPGVSIAAALVPPLCTVGIGLAIGQAGLAVGAGLLFLTNLVAIVLAGSLTLLLLGFRPIRRARELPLRLGWPVVLVLLAVITIPLAAVFVQSVHSYRIEQAAHRTLIRELQAMPKVEFVDMQIRGGETGLDIIVTVYSASAPSSAEVTRLEEALRQVLSGPLRLRVATIPITQ